MAACQRAGNAQSEMHVLNSLGNVETKRGNPQAALSWYERSQELAQRLGSVSGQATARCCRAVLLSNEAAANPDTRRNLLSQAIAEDREVLSVYQQLGQPAYIGISHNNLANHLRLAGQLDDAEHHALQALAIRTQLNDRETCKTLWLLELIAAARKRPAPKPNSAPATRACPSRRSSPCSSMP